jgi:type II secretory pathway component GspD/PulD (secretin)
MSRRFAARSLLFVACLLGLASTVSAEEGQPPAASSGHMVTIEVVIAELAGQDPVTLDPADNLSERLRELETAGKVAAVSRLRLATLDGEEARVQQGETVPVVAGVASFSRQRAGGGEPALAYNYQLESIGTLVSVRTQVQEDGSVVASLTVEKTRLGPQPAGESAEARTPTPPKRLTLQSHSTARIPAGGTVIVGGSQAGGEGGNTQALILVSAQVTQLQPAAAAGAQNDHQLQIFALQHARAAETAKLLINLFDQEPLTVAADERTNSLIVKARPAQQEVIQAILLRLDRE